MTADAPTPLARYRALVRDGALDPDPAQNAAIEQLQLLHDRLKGYEPTKGKQVARGWFGWGREAPRRDALTGLYLYGGVGRGKSMLMDLFFDVAPVSPKRRVHFHAFMQEIHAGIAAARAAGTDDPIAPVAAKVADHATLLCFDEIQITDITDAMIVGRLFEALFERGVVIVATSNRHPDELYKNGLNRDLFLPFIALMKERLDLHHLAGAADHRQDRMRGTERWVAPLGPPWDAAADARADALWRHLADGPEAPLRLQVQGREIDFPRASGRALRASFDELCARPLGPADYLALTAAVDRLLIERVPRLSRARNNEAKRFVTLIDACYEARTRLAATAEAEPEALYVEGEGAFEFERTASRLEEMRSEDWPPA
ncbi:MAG: cell division protein ZapE [Pseudomonadota bacterium]